MTAGFTLTSTDSIIHDFTNNYLYSYAIITIQ